MINIVSNGYIDSWGKGENFFTPKKDNLILDRNRELFYLIYRIQICVRGVYGSRVVNGLGCASYLLIACQL